MTQTPAPKLQPPGAGLPLLQHLFVRYWVGPRYARRANPEQTRRRFVRVHNALLEIIRAIPREQFTQPVLVPPMRGLEDSSRYWSAAMTLEHLLIVGENVKRIIQLLSDGTDPKLRPRTERVKPKGERTPEDVIAHFERFALTCMDDLEPFIAKGNSTVTEVHPWFGPMTSWAWHWLLPVHAGIHLEQIRAIQKGLANGR